MISGAIFANQMNPEAWYAVFIYRFGAWDSGRWALGRQIARGASGQGGFFFQEGWSGLAGIPAMDNAWVSIFDTSSKLVCFDTTENTLRALTFLA